MANVLGCEIIVSKFELQMPYYIHFWTLGKFMNPFFPITYRLNSNTIGLIQGWYCVLDKPWSLILKQVLTRVRAGGWRCHSDVIIVRNKPRWQGAGDVMRRKRAKFVWEFEERKSRVLDAKWEGSTFGARRRKANLHPMGGAARVGGQMNKTA